MNENDNLTKLKRIRDEIQLQLWALDALIDNIDGLKREHQVQTLLKQTNGNSQIPGGER